MIAIELTTAEPLPKWQLAHMSFIEPVWHPNKLSLSKRASMHRLIYDKGWHGGNRRKSAPPTEIEVAQWSSCGHYGAPDS